MAFSQFPRILLKLERLSNLIKETRVLGVERSKRIVTGLS